MLSMSAIKRNEELLREDFEAGPTNLDLMEENLWLGNLSAATDISVLEKKKIDHILTLDTCPLPRKITDLPNMSFLFINVTDSPSEDMISHFEETYKFISNGVKNGVVLVHCYAGISRSSTVVVAYLMKKHGLSRDSALELSKSKRRFIGPNNGFMAQLKLYEVMGCCVERENVQYRMFRLFITAHQVKQVRILPQGCSGVMKPDPALTQARPDPRCFRCRKCRRIVALASNVLPHAPKQKFTWHDPQWSCAPPKDACTDTYFVEPMTWMDSVAMSPEGRLHCPQCKAKLGSYSWTMGCECPCGTRVSPAFYLVPSKVDRSNFVKNMQCTI